METVLIDRGVTVVELARNYDAMDEDANRRLREVMGTQAEKAEPPLVLLDLSRTASIDSTFIGILFATEKQLRRRKGRLALCAADAFCSEVLRIVKLGVLFNGYSTRDEAIDALLSNGDAE